MITADGERSRKRLPVAKKALAVITDLDLSAKASLHEGFTYKVWQMDKGGLSGGRITAPAGIFVMLSDAVGFKQFVCDSFQTIAAPIFPAADPGRLFLAPNPLPLGTDGQRIAVGTSVGGDAGSTQAIQASPALIVEADPVAQWQAARAVCLPFAGEHVLAHLSFERTSLHLLNVAQITHCHSNGEGDVASPSFSSAWSYSGGHFETVANSARTIPLLTSPGYYEYMRWKTGTVFHVPPNNYPLAVAYEGVYVPSNTTFGSYVTADAVLPGASSTLLAKLRNQPITGVLLRHIAAHYSRTANDIKGVCALRPVMDYCTNTADQIDPAKSCVAQAEIDKWGLVLSFISLAGAHQTVEYSVLKPALQGLADGELAWVLAPGGYGATFTVDHAATIVGRLFGWPAESEYTNSPRDTTTFADADGAVYSWLRCTDPDAAQRAGESSGTPGGGFKFQHPEGFIRLPLVMPPEVMADTTLRARVMLMTATTYHCIADRADGEIIHLYVGSPLTEWEEVALPVGVTMYAVRVMQPGDTPATAGFIGVGKTAGIDGAPPVYRVYLKMAGAGWAGLSPLPVADVNDLIAAWDVCVFGDDPLAMSMASARQHPVAVQSRRPYLR